jgi:GTP-binding protein HflX
VGYTNAGKSTLFNALTDAKVYSADKLFATLDPTLRRMQISKGQHVVLADTVGFIQDLPHDLIEAFHATLQETHDADLILHIVDASDENRDNNIVEVESALKQIDALGVPQIMIYNKIDQIDMLPNVQLGEHGNIQQVWVSALYGRGIDILIKALRQYFGFKSTRIWLRFPPSAGNLRSELYNKDEVVQEFVDDEGYWQIEAEVPCQRLKRYTEFQIPVQSEQLAS